MRAMAHPDRIGAVLALLLLSVGFYWKLSLTDQYVWFDHGDMCYMQIPRLQFQAREIHSHRFPLWDPSIWSGQPLIGQTQPGPLFPLNLLFLRLPLRDGYIRFELLNWYYVIIRFLAAWFCYLLCRDLERSWAASVLAGCIFGFGGFIGTVAWLDVVNGAIWAPLVFLYLFRALRGERPAASAALAGFWLGIAWLSGHHEIPLLTSFAVLGVWVYAIFREGRPFRSRLRLAVLTVAVAGLISAVQLIPTYEFGRISKRWVGADQPVGWTDRIPYTVPTIYSMPVGGLLGIILPGRSTNADFSPFLGVVACSLAALGVLGAWREIRVRWMALMAAAAAAYSLGAFTPLYGVLVSTVPMLSRARYPVRGIHLLGFCLAVLAAYGADIVLEGGSPRWTRRIRLGLLGFGGLILASAVVFAAGHKPDLTDGVLLTGLVACGAAGLILASQSGALARRATFAGLLALTLTELYFVGTANYSNRYNKDQFRFVRSLTGNKDIVNFLRNEQLQRGPLRVNVSDADIPMNFGDWHGFDMLQGYVAGVTSNLLGHEFHTKRTQSLFGVTHWVARNAERPDQQEVFTGETGVKVWRNPDPMPRAWVVHEAVTAAHEGELARRIQDDTLDFHRTVLLLGESPRLDSCAGEDQVRLLRHLTDRVVISAKLPCRGMVILAETNFPGWRATVDGKPTRLWEAYGSLRGAVVEGGEHTVEFRYRPLSVYLGAALTGLGLLLTVWLVRRS